MKFFLWPLGVWLLASGRARAAGVAAVVAVGSVLLVAPFAPLDDYVRTLREVGREFDQDSYSTFGLLTQLGAGDTAARVVTFALGLVLLALTWRRASFVLAIAAALVLSPIVWFDFYALAAIPLAIARPRLSLVWFLPLADVGASELGDRGGSRLGRRPRARSCTGSSSWSRRRASRAPRGYGSQGTSFRHVGPEASRSGPFTRDRTSEPLSDRATTVPPADVRHVVRT